MHEEKEVENDQEDEEVEEGGVKQNCEMCEGNVNGWKRALADYDNLKKELMNERVQMRKYAIEQNALQLIPVLDHFDQALKYKPEELSQNTEKWLQGILHIRTQLENVILEMGVQSFGTEGETFDPNFHEAVSEEKLDGMDSGLILQVISRGWKRDDHIIYPAKVIISS